MKKDSRIWIDWSNFDNGGKKLAHACDVIYRHLDGQPQNYKIGMTHCPHSRFYKKYPTRNDELRSYAQDFNFMVVIAVHTEAKAIGIMEAAAIREFKEVRQVPGFISSS